MRDWLRPASRRAAITVLTAGVTFSFVGLSAGATSTAPTLPRLAYSSPVCAWLQLHPDRTRGLSCPPSGPTGIGATGSSISAATAPRQAGRLNDSHEAGSQSAALQFGRNVDATNYNEDLASGQSETAIAVSGSYVVTAWNDATAFLVPPPGEKSSGTGVGFSSDGGKTFADIQLPNPDPCQQIVGDPSVVSYKAKETTYFYVTSLYFPAFAYCPTNGNFEISLSVGTVAGNSISFAAPVVVANGGFFSPDPSTFRGLLDKSFAAIDRSHGKIVVSYTCLGAGKGPGNAPDACGASDIDIALCTLSDPATPICQPGSAGAAYMTLATAPPSPTGGLEEISGAYPAFSQSGDAYVTWNQNWFTNNFDGDPLTHQKATRVPAACLTGTPCLTPPPTVTVEDTVKSLDATTISGYNRGTLQDFPRIAYNNTTKRVVFVWNEANAHPLGDIVLKTADPRLANWSSKVRVNDDNSFAAHILPGVSVDGSGNINVSWYDRRNAGGTALTDVYAASIAPGKEGGKNARVTTVATEWNDTGSLIIPNFGDYTDNASDGDTLYVSWSDGRIGVPNAFVATAATAGGASGQ
jgi:hypothetical protein